MNGTSDNVTNILTKYAVLAKFLSVKGGKVKELPFSGKLNPHFHSLFCTISSGLHLYIFSTFYAITAQLCLNIFS